MAEPPIDMTALASLQTLSFQNFTMARSNQRQYVLQTLSTITSGCLHTVRLSFTTFKLDSRAHYAFEAIRQALCRLDSVARVEFILTDNEETVDEFEDYLTATFCGSFSMDVIRATKPSSRAAHPPTVGEMANSLHEVKQTTES